MFTIVFTLVCVSLCGCMCMCLSTYNLTEQRNYQSAESKTNVYTSPDSNYIDTHSHTLENHTPNIGCRKGLPRANMSYTQRVTMLTL